MKCHTIELNQTPSTYLYATGAQFHLCCAALPALVISCVALMGSCSKTPGQDCLTPADWMFVSTAVLQAPWLPRQWEGMGGKEVVPGMHVAVLEAPLLPGNAR